MQNNKVCENCGNKYDKAFVISMNDKEHVFDSFECAINILAPRCEACDCRIIGHGVEAKGKMYCCAHCANHEGHLEIVDRV